MKNILLLFIALFMTSQLYAADQKLTALTGDIAPTSDDLVYVVVDVATTAVERKVLLSDLPISDATQTEIDTKQDASANLDTYSAITPSSNTQAFLSSPNYTDMVDQLSLVIGVDTQAYDVNNALTTTKLDDFGTPDDNTDLDATTGRHGLLPKLGGGTVNFLRADGTWAPTAAGGDLKADGTVPLTNDWDMGAYEITVKGVIVPATDVGGQYIAPLEDTDNGTNYQGWGIFGNVIDSVLLAIPLVANTDGQMLQFAPPGNQAMGDGTTKIVAVGTWIDDPRFEAIDTDDLSDPTTPSILTTAETTNKCISNYKATGADHVYTMAAAHPKGNVIFPIGDEFQVDIEPDSGENFYLNGTAMATDEHIQNTADTLGEQIVGFCVNINGTLTWMFESKYTNFVEETP